MIGSLDRTSPMSMSLASSEGQSWSLRSVTEIKNLSQLAESGVSSTLFSQSNGISVASTSTSKQAVSDDIPVPSTSHSHYYKQ